MKKLKICAWSALALSLLLTADLAWIVKMRNLLPTHNQVVACWCALSLGCVALFVHYYQNKIRRGNY